MRAARLIVCGIALASCTGDITGRGPTGGSGGEGPQQVNGGSSAGAQGDPGVVSGPSTPPPGRTCAKDVDAGRTTIRRLTRDEFDATVRDLLGDDTRPGRGFPDDDSSDADLLTFSTLLLEKVEAAAHTLVEAAWQRELAGKQPAGARLFVCQPSAANTTCAQSIVKAFARRAFRAQPSAQDLEPYLALIGKDGVEGTKDALEALLLAPRFLYRMELDPPGAPATRALTAHEVAARLSYSLWASLPDARLDGLADSGALLTPANLEAEVIRMLADPKAEALTSSFAARWLSFPSVENAKPDPILFPDMTPAMLTSMRDETAALVRALFADQGSLLDVVSAPFTYANGALAKHYGLSTAAADNGPLERISLGSGERRGVLGHGSFLVTTSTPTRTSAVKRGKWVLGRLLCMPPPPPPPGAAVQKPEAVDAKTERERLSVHRADPRCAACHDAIDPIGLGLESYDPVARMRTQVNGVTLDLSGTLPGGRSFTGAAELANRLREDRDYAGCVSKQLLTWALGRQPEDADACLVGEVADALGKTSAKTSDGLLTIVRSRAFLNRRTEPVGAM